MIKQFKVYFFKCLNNILFILWFSKLMNQTGLSGSLLFNILIDWKKVKSVEQMSN